MKRDLTGYLFIAPWLLDSWNDFMGPLIYINDPNRYTLAYGLQQFYSSYGGKWAQLMAGATLFTLPIIVL